MLVLDKDLLSLAIQKISRHEGTRHQRSFSTKIEYNGVFLFIKTAKKNLHNEAISLQLAAKLNIDNIFSVPFVTYDKKHNLLITRYINGSNFFNFLWNYSSWYFFWKPLTEWQKMFFLLGRWLYAFHRLDIQEKDYEKCFSFLYKTLQDKMLLLDEVDSYFLSHTSRKKILDFAFNIFDSIHNEKFMVCRIHGDFIHSNILIDNHRNIYIYDFADSRIGFSLEDVARFWTGIWEISKTRKIRANVFKSCLQAFLRGYGIDISTVNSSIFILLRIWNSIIRILDTSLALNKKHFSWRMKRLLKRLTYPHVKWLLSLI